MTSSDPIKQYLKSKLSGTAFLKNYYMLYPQRPLYRESIWQSFLLSRWIMWCGVYLRMIVGGSTYYRRFKGHLNHVVDHNRMENGGATFCRRRSEHLIYLMKSIPTLKMAGKTLSIGPRNEGEILLLRAHGFKNVAAIDLFTYSDLIQVMDMHAMTFPSNTFDTLVAGWVLPYSSDLYQCVQEIVRVSRDGCIIALSFSGHRPRQRKSRGLGTLVESTGQILSYFGDRVAHVYWNLDGENEYERDVPYRTHSLVFRLRK